MNSSGWTQTDLARIVERSAFLYEREGPEFTWSSEASGETATRLDRWAQMAAKGDRQSFEQRLDWERGYGGRVEGVKLRGSDQRIYGRRA